MALYVDDLDRTIIIDDVPNVFNGVYADSIDELLAFCNSAKIRPYNMLFKTNLRHRMIYLLKGKRNQVRRFGGHYIKYGETPWLRDQMDWD